MPQTGFWQLWIDTGGTFTDCLAIAPDGARKRAKVLSHSALRAVAFPQPDGDPRGWRLEAPWQVPAGFFGEAQARSLGASTGVAVESFDPATGRLRLTAALPLAAGAARDDRAPVAIELRFPEEPPVLAARLVTGTSAGQALPTIRLRLATTRGTNALLERRGAPVALFITAGFGDLLLIGDQQRPDLFTLDVRKSPPLYDAVREVGGRLRADGKELAPLDLVALRKQAEEVVRRGIRSAAVALLHAYREPAHERAVRDVLRAAGCERVSLSSDLAPRLGLLVRAQTAVVDAYLAPVIGDYLDRVATGLGQGTAGEGPGGARLHVMNSAGGLLERTSFRAKDALLSGPAGGVVGAVAAARASGIDELVAFDMGGTSTDVSRYHDRFEYTFEHTVGDARVAAPALRVATVAAGGGSICRSDGHALLVGPQSAGADPGPACYGAGGPLTLTDVNLLLGRLVPERFAIPLDGAAAGRALAMVTARLPGAGADTELLAGFLRIANERMADAIRRISVREGYDPRSATLVAFGGAGGQHACALADLLGMRRVLVPADASLLSARGLGAAVFERFAEEQVLRLLGDPDLDVRTRLRALAVAATDEVLAQGADVATTTRRLAFLRLQGQDASIAIELSESEAVSPADLADLFAAAYRGVYGYPAPARPIEVESLRVVAASPAVRESSGAPPALATQAGALARPLGRRAVWFEDAWSEVDLYDRERLATGEAFRGPCLVLEAHCATVVEPGWHGVLDAAGAMLLERGSPDALAPGMTAEPG